MKPSATHPLNAARDLERLRIVTERGRFLGHVFDLRGSWQPGAGAFVVDEVVYGRMGLLVRLGLAHGGAKSVRWSQVRVVRGDAIVVADDAG